MNAAQFSVEDFVDIDQGLVRKSARIRLAAVRGRVLWDGMKCGASRPLIDTDLVAQRN
jgi:hypothetical protein